MTVTAPSRWAPGRDTHAAEAVQQMFNTIAPRYDLLNHVLSANIDRLWWSPHRFAVSLRPHQS